MSESHLAYLSLGSNIQPEDNLVRAVALLSEHGEVLKISSVWESRSVGAEGPNYLNACVLFRSSFNRAELKEQVIRSIEAQLGRGRNEDKYVPRTIDIDVILFDDKPVNEYVWSLAYVVVPLAEIYPEYQIMTTSERVAENATRLRNEVWMETRRDILSQFRESNFKS